MIVLGPVRCQGCRRRVVLRRLVSGVWGDAPRFEWMTLRGEFHVCGRVRWLTA